MKHQTKLNKVVAIIKKYPAAANSDVTLIEQYWLSEGWDERKSLYYNLSHVTRPETITRRRREAFKQGLITYSPKALEERTEAFTNERDAHSAISWLKD